MDRQTYEIALWDDLNRLLSAVKTHRPSTGPVRGPQAEQDERCVGRGRGVRVEDGAPSVRLVVDNSDLRKNETGAK